MRKIQVSYSQVSCFKDCRKKYKFRYIEGLVPKKTKGFLTIGKAVHKAIEAYYGGDNVSKQVSIPDKA